MIVNCLSELLYDHECVIIPELGAFISKEHPATLDYANHRLNPPSKEVVFNGQLTADDDLFVDYVSYRMSVTREKARRMTHDFAMRSLAILESDETLHLEGVGNLKRVNGNDYVFALDEKQNFLGDAFGLPAFSVQPVYRSETYHHIAMKIAHAHKEKNTSMTVLENEKEKRPRSVNRYNYKWFRAAAYSMTIAMLLVLLGWGADKSDSNYALWNPFFYSSPNEFIARRLDAKMESRVTVANVETLPSLQWTIPVNNNEVDYIEPLDYELLKPVDVRFYHIIGASLNNDEDAQKCVRRFQKQGFDNAEALPKNKDGNVRVAYELVMGKEAALKRLEIIKKEHNEAAWLLRKK